jgi:hypothetical protein
MLDHEVTLNKEPLTCPRCGEPFTCGLAVGDAHCWCFDVPHKAVLGKKLARTGCICPKCLQAAIDEIIAAEGVPQEPDVKHDPQITLK